MTREQWLEKLERYFEGLTTASIRVRKNAHLTASVYVEGVEHFHVGEADIWLIQTERKDAESLAKDLISPVSILRHPRLDLGPLSTRQQEHGKHVIECIPPSDWEAFEFLIDVLAEVVAPAIAALPNR